MKSNLFLIIFILACSPSFVSAQLILAGLHGSNDSYVDLNPDSIVYSVNPMLYHNIPSNSDTLLLDMNGDSINDFRLITVYANGQQWFQKFYSTIEPLNNNSIAISQFDSCFTYLFPPVFQYVTPLVKAYSINDSIDQNAQWIDSTAYFAYSEQNAYYFYCYNNSFANADLYAGVRILKENDTLYGWIKVQAGWYDSISVQEYACNLKSNGIDTILNKTSFEIFPNPTNGIFHIIDDRKNFVPYYIDIFNMLGEKISRIKVNSGNAEINMLDKPRGIYFVKRTLDNESKIKKLIIN